CPRPNYPELRQGGHPGPMAPAWNGAGPSALDRQWRRAGPQRCLPGRVEPGSHGQEFPVESDHRRRESRPGGRSHDGDRLDWRRISGPRTADDSRPGSGLRHRLVCHFAGASPRLRQLASPRSGLNPRGTRFFGPSPRHGPLRGRPRRPGFAALRLVGLRLDAHAVALYFGPNHGWFGATERRALASACRGHGTDLVQPELVHSALDAPTIDWHAAAP